MRGHLQHLVLVIALFAGAHGHAQNREGAVQEAAREGAIEACAGQPECVAAMRGAEARQAAADARWEAKPLDQKLEPYLWIALAIGTVGYLLRRRRR